VPNNPKGIYARDSMIGRMIETATMLGYDGSEFVECKYPGEARWRVSERWIEFECGCTCERFAELWHVRTYDPVIFRNLPELAIYEKVCHFHNPAMNVRVKFGGFVDFAQWHRIRRPTLTRK
jgi:hypothetical protein